MDEPVLVILGLFFKTGLILPAWQVNGVVRSLSLPEPDPGIEPEHGRNDLKVLPVVDKDGNNAATSILTGMGSRMNRRNFKVAWGFVSLVLLGPYCSAGLQSREWFIKYER